MPSVSQQQRVNVQSLTASGCLLATKCFVEYALATILNERGLLPGSCFMAKDLTSPSTGKTYQALRLNSAELTKHPSAQAPFKVSATSMEDLSNKVIVLQNWLKGIYEALDAGYLRSLTLEVLSANDHQPLESYCIDFTTTQCDSPRRTTGEPASPSPSQRRSQRTGLHPEQGHQRPAIDKDQVREQMYTMLAQLKESLSKFELPPTSCLLSMTLQYTSSTPPEYEPLSFCAADQATRRRSSQLAIRTAEEGSSLIESGWATPYNAVTVRVIPPKMASLRNTLVQGPTSTLVTPFDSGRSSPTVRRILSPSVPIPVADAPPSTLRNTMHRAPSASVPGDIFDFPSFMEPTGTRLTDGERPTLRTRSPGTSAPMYVELLLDEANRLSHVDTRSEVFAYLSAFVFVCSLPGDMFSGVFPAQHPAADRTSSTPAADEPTTAVILQHLVSDGVLTAIGHAGESPSLLEKGGAFPSQPAFIDIGGGNSQDPSAVAKGFIIEKSTRLERLCHLVSSAPSLEKPLRVLFNKPAIRTALEPSHQAKKVVPSTTDDDPTVGVSVIDRPCHSLTPASTLGTTLPSSCPSRKRKRHG